MENDQYFQGILQLRHCTDEVANFARKECAKAKVSIAKEVAKKDSLDIYLSSNNFLRKLGRMLKSKYPGIVKESAKLFTRDRQTFKNVYRCTVLFRMSDFNNGDKGILMEEEVEIMSIGEKVTVKNIKSGARKQYKFEELAKSFKKF